jgi:hypothetical protein
MCIAMTRIGQEAISTGTVLNKKGDVAAGNQTGNTIDIEIGFESIQHIVFIVKIEIRKNVFISLIKNWVGKFPIGWQGIVLKHVFSDQCKENSF